nr:MAG TPA: hypothetical protein [Caudoviricetes sp.]
MKVIRENDQIGKRRFALPALISLVGAKLYPGIVGNLLQRFPTINPRAAQTIGNHQKKPPESA